MRIWPATIAVVVFFAANQLPAQQIMGWDIADSANATTSGQGSHDAVAAARPATSLSAPVPNIKEAMLVKPLSDSLYSLAVAQDNAGSSSPTPAPKTKAAKMKARHHGLGVALAISGLAVTGIGVAAIVVQGKTLCANESQGGCAETRHLGYAGIGVGVPVAALGFYFQFHK